jgi:hypothetical protein
MGVGLTVVEGVMIGLNVRVELGIGVGVIVGRGVKVEVEVEVAVNVMVGVGVGVCKRRRIRPGKLQLKSNIHTRMEKRPRACSSDGIICDTLRMMG